MAITRCGRLSVCIIINCYYSSYPPVTTKRKSDWHKVTQQTSWLNGCLSVCPSACLPVSLNPTNLLFPFPIHRDVNKHTGWSRQLLAKCVYIHWGAAKEVKRELKYHCTHVCLCARVCPYVQGIMDFVLLEFCMKRKWANNFLEIFLCRMHSISVPCKSWTTKYSIDSDFAHCFSKLLNKSHCRDVTDRKAKEYEIGSNVSSCWLTFMRHLCLWEHI